MDRRHFIKSSGTLALAAALPQAAGAAGREASTNLKLKKVALSDGWDVIVIGGGPAGSVAASAAAREGAKTLLIEGTGPLLFFPDNTPHPAYIEVRKTYQRWSLLRTGVDLGGRRIIKKWIDMPQTDLDVFNLAGQKVLEGVSYDQVLELPKGLYIVGGKKFMIQ